MRTVLILIVLTFGYDLCHSQDEPVNLSINTECTIPNQVKTKGICVKRQNCAEYEDLFNVTDLTTERLSFAINLYCGFDSETWKPLVCCPNPGESYKYVTLKDVFKIM